MSIPSYLDTDFAYQQLTGVVDTATVRDAIITMITSTLPVASRWTLTSGYRYKSPPDSAGRFMEVDVTSSSTSRMKWVVYDHIGLVSDGTIDLSTGGSTVYILAGPKHLFVDMYNTTGNELGRAVICDGYPESNNSFTKYILCSSHRNSSGTVLGAWTSQPNTWRGRCIDSTIRDNDMPVGFAAPFGPGAINYSTVNLKTESGLDVCIPLIFAIYNANTAIPFRKSGGKLTQCMLVPSSKINGTTIEIPLDSNSVGTFFILNGATVNSQGYGKLAVRCA